MWGDIMYSSWIYISITRWTIYMKNIVLGLFWNWYHMYLIVSIITLKFSNWQNYTEYERYYLTSWYCLRILFVCVIVVYCQVHNFPAISWWEQVTFWWDDDGDVHFVLEHAEFNMYSASSLKQQSTGRHIAPLGHYPDSESLFFW